MAKLDYSELYTNCTMLTDDFLASEFGYRLDTEYEEIVYKNYYVNMCDAVYQLNAFRPTSAEIEEILTNGKAERFSQCKSDIPTELERKYLFLLAQAKQLKYDRDNGRASMIRGENNSFNICEDSKQLLARVGLIQPIWF